MFSSPTPRPADASVGRDRTSACRGSNLPQAPARCCSGNAGSIPEGDDLPGVTRSLGEAAGSEARRREARDGSSEKFSTTTRSRRRRRWPRPSTSLDFKASVVSVTAARTVRCRRGDGRIAKTIVLYSQPGLFFCGKVKKFLSRKRIVYVERDISRDEQALEESFAQIGGGAICSDGNRLGPDGISSQGAVLRRWSTPTRRQEP